MTFMMNVMKEGERERNRNVIVAENYNRKKSD